MRFALLMVLFAAASLLAGTVSAEADFTPPKNGKLTEEQIICYISVTRKVAALSDVDRAIDKKSDAAMTAAFEKDIANSFAFAKQHGMSQAEYRWVEQKISDLFPVASWEELKPAYDERIKGQKAQIKSLKDELALCQQAQKDGKWYERSVAAQKFRRDGLLAELDNLRTSIKESQDEIDAADKNAAEIERLERNPPADRPAESQAEYLQRMKGSAVRARKAGDDARTSLEDAQSGLQIFEKERDRLNAQIEHPDPAETPATDAEKSMVAQQNQRYVENLARRISEREESLADIEKDASKLQADAERNPSPDADNLALLEKHLEELSDARRNKPN